jgi:hypothetical protein
MQQLAKNVAVQDKRVTTLIYYYYYFLRTTLN